MAKKRFNRLETGGDQPAPEKKSFFRFRFRRKLEMDGDDYRERTGDFEKPQPSELVPFQEPPRVPVIDPPAPRTKKVERRLRPLNEVELAEKRADIEEAKGRMAAARANVIFGGIGIGAVLLIAGFYFLPAFGASATFLKRYTIGVVGGLALLFVYIFMGD